MEDHSMELDLSSIPAAISGGPSESFIRASSVKETVLSAHENVKTRIADHEKVSGGMFAMDYINYKLETAPTGWTVKRRYSDFVWLR